MTNKVESGDDIINVASKANGDGSLTYIISANADGKIAEGDTKIVTGDTIYNEVRIKKDGNYIKKEKTSAENLSALDEQVHNNATNIENINNQVNDTRNQVNSLDNRMKKGLAGAAALAALHPMDFNPDDKLQFAAGVGNYRGETAARYSLWFPKKRQENKKNREAIPETKAIKKSHSERGGIFLWRAIKK